MSAHLRALLGEDEFNSFDPDNDINPFSMEKCKFKTSRSASTPMRSKYSTLSNTDLSQNKKKEYDRLNHAPGSADCDPNELFSHMGVSDPLFTETSTKWNHSTIIDSTPLALALSRPNTSQDYSKKSYANLKMRSAMGRKLVNEREELEKESNKRMKNISLALTSGNEETINAIAGKYSGMIPQITKRAKNAKSGALSASLNYSGEFASSDQLKQNVYDISGDIISLGNSRPITAGSCIQTQTNINNNINNTNNNTDFFNLTQLKIPQSAGSQTNNKSKINEIESKINNEYRLPIMTDEAPLELVRNFHAPITDLQTGVRDDIRQRFRAVAGLQQLASTRAEAEKSLEEHQNQFMNQLAVEKAKRAELERQVGTLQATIDSLKCENDSLKSASTLMRYKTQTDISHINILESRLSKYMDMENAFQSLEGYFLTDKDSIGQKDNGDKSNSTAPLAIIERVSRLENALVESLQRTRIAEEETQSLRQKIVEIQRQAEIKLSGAEMEARENISETEKHLIELEKENQKLKETLNSVSHEQNDYLQLCGEITTLYNEWKEVFEVHQLRNEQLQKIGKIPLDKKKEISLGDVICAVDNSTENALENTKAEGIDIGKIDEERRRASEIRSATNEKLKKNGIQIRLSNANDTLVVKNQNQQCIHIIRSLKDILTMTFPESTAANDTFKKLIMFARAQWTKLFRDTPIGQQLRGDTLGIYKEISKKTSETLISQGALLVEIEKLKSQVAQLTRANELTRRRALMAESELKKNRDLKGNK